MKNRIVNTFLLIRGIDGLGILIALSSNLRVKILKSLNLGSLREKLINSFKREAKNNLIERPTKKEMKRRARME
jgi:hypothetical protein